MKKVKFIYNPYSGDRSIRLALDKVIQVNQRYGYSIEPYRISIGSTIDDAFNDLNEYDYILAAGGDGTIDNIVNMMKKHNIDLPIGILPTGTANDFAKFIGMPKNIEAACEQILTTEPRKVDIGKINEKYFINVASMGLFTDVSQKTDINVKNTIGKMAYYMKGIEQVPNLRKLRIKVDAENANFDGDMYLMFVFNGRTAGNLNLAYKSEINDGLLDVIIVKAGMMMDIFTLFFKMLKEEHLRENSGLIYFKTDKLRIECNEGIVTDIDGERGPDFPLEVECVKNGITILGIKD